MMYKINLRLAQAVALVSMVGFNAASAAEIEEIKVTAQKREADVLDVPVAIEVFSGDKLEHSGVEDLDDLTQVSSSFNINTTAIDAQITIRGVGSQNLSTGAYGSTAVYIDGVYYPRPYGITSSLGKLDGIESLQILKGPQGTIFGRNATAGALVITTRSPEIGEEVNGSFSVTAGNYGVQEYQGSVYSGLTDTLAGSLNFSIHKSDGFIENTAPVGHDLDDEDGYKIEGKLVWEPTERLKFNFKGLLAEDARNSNPGQQVGQYDDFGLIPGLNNPQVLWVSTVLNLAGSFFPVLGASPLSPAQTGAIIGAAAGLQFSDKVGRTYTDHIPDHWEGTLDDGTSLSGGQLEDNDINAGSWNRSKQFSLQVNYSFDSFDIVGIGSYLDFEQEASSEILRADGTTVPNWSTVAGLDPSQVAALSFITSQSAAIGFSGNQPGESYSGEIYAVSTNSDIEWIAGLYYFYEEGDNQVTAGAFEFDGSISKSAWEVESLAPYVEVNFPLTEALTLTTGMRYTKEDAEVEDLLFIPTHINVGKQDRSDSQTTYNAKLAYQFDEWLVYGGYSTGFKSGSVNPGSPENGQVDPEEITAYEVGFKGAAWDGRVTLEGAAFYYEYENLQLNVLNTVNSSTILIDGAEAEVTGLELSAVIDATDNTRVNLGATYLDHEYVTDGVIPATLTGGAAVPFVIKGNDLAMTPDLVVIAGLEHILPLANGGDLTFNGSLNYNSGFWIDTTNHFGSSGDENDDFTVVNSSITYHHPNNQFSVSLYVNNLFDEEYFRGGLEAAGALAQLASAGRPRHYGATFQYNF